MTEQLLEYREKITEIDSNLLKLLAERKSLVQNVAAFKLENNMAVRDLNREEKLLLKLIEQGEALGLHPVFISQVFHAIIEDSVLNQQANLQANVNPGALGPVNKVAHLGAHGSYSYFATQKYFAHREGQLVEIGCDTFIDIIDHVEKGLADFGMLPIENTSSGSINEVYDLLQHTNLSIVGEMTQPVRHCLMTAVDTEVHDIELIYAHPQVHAQCSQFLNRLKNVTVEHCQSTSDAFERVKNAASPKVAAIGSAEGGKAFNLCVIKEALANQKENHSRFIVVARKPVVVAEQIPAKTTFIMATDQKPGALVDALMILKAHNINMSKLESRPIQGNPWEEMFYVDVLANNVNPNFKAAMTALEHTTRFIKVLGCYPSDSIKPVYVAEQHLRSAN